MRVLIFGITGMLGNAMFKLLSEDSQYKVWGTLRSESGRQFFTKTNQSQIMSGINVLDQDSLVAILNRVRPEIVINCAGVIKQLPTANDVLTVLPLNAIFPHRLAHLCNLLGSRLIQLSSDCVYSGRKGNYQETDFSDAEDLYGKSKFIGELHDYSHAITLRTSGIGHELNSHNGLLEWFLTQQNSVKGYEKAIYSGLPSVELARIIKDFILPHPELNGLYHVSAKPIAKLHLLKLIANVYGKNIKIISDNNLIIDRSLNSERFTRMTGYVAPDWPDLITLMHNSR